MALGYGAANLGRLFSGVSQGVLKGTLMNREQAQRDKEFALKERTVGVQEETLSLAKKKYGDGKYNRQLTELANRMKLASAYYNRSGRGDEGEAAALDILNGNPKILKELGISKAQAYKEDAEYKYISSDEGLIKIDKQTGEADYVRDENGVPLGRKQFAASGAGGEAIRRQVINLKDLINSELIKFGSKGTTIDFEVGDTTQNMLRLFSSLKKDDKYQNMKSTLQADPKDLTGKKLEEWKSAFTSLNRINVYQERMRQLILGGEVNSAVEKAIDEGLQGVINSALEAGLPEGTDTSIEGQDLSVNIGEPGESPVGPGAAPGRPAPTGSAAPRGGKTPPYLAKDVAGYGDVPLSESQQQAAAMAAKDNKLRGEFMVRAFARWNDIVRQHPELDDAHEGYDEATSRRVWNAVVEWAKK